MRNVLQYDPKKWYFKVQTHKRKKTVVVEGITYSFYGQCQSLAIE